MTRDEALKKMQAVKSYMTSGNPIWSVTEIGEAFDMAIEALEQPERKTGKWIEDVKSKRYRCDQCLSFALRTDDGKENLSDFCPVCGAMMKENSRERKI